MEELYPALTVFLLIAVRVSAFFVTIPLLSHRTIPPMHRIGFALLLSWMMYYTMDVEPLEVDGEYILLIVKEACVGLFIGLIAYIVLSAIQIAGNFIDFQMGFAIANVIDPQTGAQTPLMGQYLYTLSLLLLLTFNGHHLILDGIFYSYQFIPIDKIGLGFNEPMAAEIVIKTFAATFLIAFQIASPVVATLFLVDIALGIVARTSPQFNIFVIGFPIKITVAFIILVILMGVTFQVIQRLFDLMFLVMRDMMTVLGGGAL
ncbi:flagellar biosynthetic protein FliR [Jeotgalibacillus proteolyticus]|uniref:Flagellar biosynthetic protein FliR n=1 Tax=Jeotgalibacillus proteolyticus TaxID=2082395 RepID=A0A2S5GGK4_9BACL|nr:flagellar biosynthetic protein FliR [Jeotgalibacillus proteolyticus]PPA72045.1 flagellar type III secretion system protein FliR [Jeotgalibacillus proteolyticus]